MACANWEEEEIKYLFVDLWVTMWVRICKLVDGALQTSKKAVQESKRLRRKLQGGTEN